MGPFISPQSTLTNFYNKNRSNVCISSGGGSPSRTVSWCIRRSWKQVFLIFLTALKCSKNDDILEIGIRLICLENWKKLLIINSVIFLDTWVVLVQSAMALRNNVWFAPGCSRVYLFVLQDSLTVVVEDLRLCSVKPCEDIERRFCFEVVSPTKWVHLRPVHIPPSRHLKQLRSFWVFLGSL